MARLALRVEDMAGHRRASLAMLCLCTLGLPVAAQPATNGDLSTLLAEKPAAGFAEAARRLADLAAKPDTSPADLLSVTRALADPSVRCLYTQALDAAADATAAAGEKAGDLGIAAEAEALCALAHWRLWQKRAGPTEDALRMVRHADKALAAYARIGKDSLDLEPLRADLEVVRKQVTQIPERWLPDTYFLVVCPDYAADLTAAWVADYEGRDKDAVAKAASVLTRLASERNSVRANTALLPIARCAGLPGGDKLLAGIRSAWRADGSARSAAVLTALARACTDAWSGEDDAYRDAYSWALERYLELYLTAGPSRIPPPVGWEWFAVKLSAFGRADEATALMTRWRAVVLQGVRADPDLREWPWPWPSADSVLPGEGDGAARDTLALWREVASRVPVARTRTIEALSAEYAALADGASPEQRPWRAYAAGVGLLELAARLPLGDARTAALATAARLVESSGHAEAATQTRNLVASFAAGDPRSLLRWALGNAQAAAAAGRFDDVVAQLGEPALKCPGEEESVQAGLLLATAQEALGDGGQAEEWLAAAESALGGLTLAPAKRAYYECAIADASKDPARRTRLLEQARLSADEARIPVLQTRIAQKLAEAALAGQDLATAERALLDLVARSEAARGALVLNPVLRRGWFADSLGPYRQLLRVMALEGKPLLALACGERMRARTLLDELAWRKVEVGAGLSEDMRTQVASLAEERGKAYAALQRSLGVSGGTAGRDPFSSQAERGSALITPSGPPGASGDPESADDLRALLESLATKEAALESAVRERVPAYAAAAETPQLTGEELATRLAEDPGRAVLQYGLCEDGVVIVGVGPRGEQRVHHAAIEAGALRAKVDLFRDQIQSRDAGALRTSQELYDLLIGPMADLIAGAERLWIAPDGLLQMLPFSALSAPDGRALGERMAIACTPSLTLALSKVRDTVPGSSDALIVAAPATTRAPSGRAATSPPEGLDTSPALAAMSMIPLPGARAEGDAIAAVLGGSTLVVGADATRARFLQEAPRFAIIHIATHGYIDPDVPDFSGLLFAGDGDKPFTVLTAGDIYGMDLGARLVTLSACQTALGKTVEGEGVLGLARAFLYAGAEVVVCSLWPVSDESTARLMESFYRSVWVGKATPEVALQRAQAAVAADPAFSAPYYWAGFVVVRGGQKG